MSSMPSNEPAPSGSPPPVIPPKMDLSSCFPELYCVSEQDLIFVASGGKIDSGPFLNFTQHAQSCEKCKRLAISYGYLKG